MPNDEAAANEKGVRRLEQCLWVDPHQSIFLAPGKIEAIVINNVIFDDPIVGGYELDKSRYRVKFDHPPEYRVYAIVTDSGPWPQMAYQNWP